MCRQNHALGLVIAAFFAGLLIGGCCDMSFGLFFIAVGGIGLGIGFLKRK